MNERGTFTRAAMLGGAFHGRVTFQRIGTVAFLDVHVGIIREEFGNISAGGLKFHGDRDGVAVVFDVKQDRKFFGAGGIQRFVEFAFAGGAFAG